MQDTHAFCVPYRTAIPALLQGSKEKDALWVLKADVHRGKGLHFSRSVEAAQEARLATKGGDTEWVVAQRFVPNQYLVANRPFYLRWVPTIVLLLPSS